MSIFVKVFFKSTYCAKISVSHVMQKQLNYDMFYNLVFAKQFVVYKLHSVLQPALLTIQSPFYFEY